MNDPDRHSYHDLYDDLRNALLRGKTTIAIVFLAALIAGYGILSLLGERYEAQGRLLVKLGRENTEVPLTVEKGTVYATGVQKEEINSYIRLLQSTALIEETVDQIGVDRFNFRAPPPTTVLQRVKYEVKRVAKWTRRQVDEALIVLDLRKRMTEREQVVRLLERSLEVLRERDSNVILMSVRLPDPQLAKQVIGVLTDKYMRRHIALRRNADARTVFDEQTEAYRKEVESLQTAASEIKREWNVSSVNEQRAQLLTRLHALKREVDESNTTIARLEHTQQKRGELLSQLPLTSRASESTEPNPRVESIKASMTELQLKRVRTASRYTEDSELVKTIDREMQSLKDLLAAEGSTQLGEVQYQPHPLTEEFLRQVEQDRVQLAGLQAGLELQMRQVAAIERELQELNEGEDKLRMADLQRQVAEQKYLAYAMRREEARIAQLFDAHRVANVTVLSEPTAGTLPVYPRKMLMMGVTAATGLMLGVAWAVFQGRRRPIIYASEDLAHTDFPVLGVLRVGQ